MGSPYVHRLRVRYGECDRQGVVFNANYLAYFDIVMTELWRAAFESYDAMARRGIEVVVAEAQLRYLAAARFDDELDLEMAIERVGNSSLTARFRIGRDAETLVEGMNRYVCVDATTMRKTEIPDWMRAALQPWTLS